MNPIIQAIVIVAVAILAIWLVGILAAEIAVIPAIIWTLLKVVIGIAAIWKLLQLFGVTTV